MAVNLSPIWGAGAQLLDNSGNVLSGGKIYTYAAGTTTQVTTYTSNTGVTANSNPIVLNSAGRVPYEIWLVDGQNYKFVLKDSNDVLIGTWDNLSGINSNFIAYTNEQEIQTATAGQTVFALTTMQYLPGTNSLSVFVDGVNQYGPGAQYAYEETDSTTVTFASGLHVGAEVKFTSSQIQNSGVADASQISYTYPAIDAVTESVEEKLAQTVSVKDFGAVGDGVTDDTVAIQNALDYMITSTTSKSLYIPTGVYKLTDTLSARNKAAYDTGNYMIYGDGISSVLYQTGAGKDVLVIGSYSTGATTTDIQEGVTLSSFSLVGTIGTSKGLYVNSVARSFFDNLYICADEYDLYIEGCLINTWDGIKLSYANFNENPIDGIVLPTTREYGLYVAPSNQGYTTNVFNSLVIEGHSVGGAYVAGGSTNTYNNLVCEGELGYGVTSASEWDVFNGVYIEAITGTALTLQNTQKITVNSFFSNTENITISNAAGTFTNCRANFTFENTADTCVFINCDGTLTYDNAQSGSYNRFVNCFFNDLTHKVDYTGTDCISGGVTNGFSSVAPRALQTGIQYALASPTSGRWGAGDKVYFSNGNASGNLGPLQGGYIGSVCVNRQDTTLSSSISSGATTLPVASVSNMAIGDVIGVNTSGTTYVWTTITAFGAGPTITVASGITGGAASGAAVVTNRWNLMGAGSGIAVLDLASATPSVQGGCNYVSSGAGTINNLTDGVPGQKVVILADHAVTVTDGTNIFLSGSANFVMKATDTLTLIQKLDGKWYELCRSVN